MEFWGLFLQALLSVEVDSNTVHYPFHSDTYTQHIPGVEHPQMYKECAMNDQNTVPTDQPKRPKRTLIFK
ncbi:hypothetical protein G7K_4842-t1 [Saitoella complicata NRRL Y-17804]|uniref:Uncharacterized protein n=1 Tax=Saitoella complicata (strain BCRC 22490 / CBS 7301 / JCM 7358 / NBRC 10748 / NRRL Y-17804) TaxID=698492 RepID=A0A0E9NLZ9_SAICN|nr:hypothetical protein G7K_4842-t1 [Saitoella complicata NRRL Y-17804]